MTQELPADLLIGMEEDALASASAEQPESMVDLVARAHSLTNQIEDLDQTTKAAKVELEDLMRRRIPAEMDKAGMSELGMTVNNHRVRLALDFAAYGSLTKAPDFQAAVAYLEENGFEGGVLTTVSAQFRRELHAEAIDLAKKIEEGGNEAHIVEDVNSSTLRAFVRQKATEGTNFDPAVVGVTIVRQAKFTVR